ncbi:MAG: hypothetical protein ACOYOV_16970 [Bacteroidales bacterium]
MKKINLFLLTMLISTVIFAQKLNVSDVAAQVTTDFKNRFPAAEKAIWSKDNALVKVNFINDGNSMELAYQNNNWLQTKWIIANEFAPQKIKEYTTQFYLGYKIKEIGFLDKNSGERIYEVVIIKKKKPNLTLIFDTGNTFLRIDGEVKDPKEVKDSKEVKESKDVKEIKK